jgi:hypothetical protein
MSCALMASFVVGGDETSGFYPHPTERRGRVVNTRASYLVGTGFKSRPGNRQLTVAFRGFPPFIWASAGIIPSIRQRLLHSTFLPVHH